VQATCNNTFGSFNCKCKDGYSGDGFDCFGFSFILFRDLHSFLKKKKKNLTFYFSQGPTNVGTCYGSNTNFNQGTCNCNSGFSLPTTGFSFFLFFSSFLFFSFLFFWPFLTSGGPNTGIYFYNFGLSTTPVVGDYVIATGAIIGNVTSFGTFGWDTDHTSQVTQ